MTSAARQRAELTSQITALLAATPPGVDEVTAFRALGQAARNIPGCAELLDHLRDHPDALTSGSAHAPPSLIRLAHALAAAGVPGVVLPGCAGCGKVTADLRSWPGAGLACQSCYQDARRRPCANCGTTGRVAASGPAGPVCVSCYPKVRAASVPCPSCGKPRVLTNLDQAGQAICGPCAGQPGGYLCGRCGGPADCLVRGLCSRCALDVRVREVLGEHDTGHLAAIGQALRAADNPKSVLTWLSRSSSARLLAYLARHHGLLTHELIDTCPRSQARSQIRHALVHAGVLPPREERIEDVEAWLADQLRDAPRHHAQLIGQFGRWIVLRRARNRVRTRTFTEASGSWARQQIRVALGLLVWLDQRGTALADLTQPDIDDWLTSGPSQRYTIRYFLRWASSRQLAPSLTVPLRKIRNPDQILPEAQRWDQLQRCLRDESLPLRVRVAGGLLLLLYGYPVSRTVEMKTTQISHRDGNTYLTFDQHPVLLPPAMTRLITELGLTATPAAVLGGRGNQTTWLFPGQVPGRNLAVNGLVRQLGDHGIQARTSRSAALVNLATDLPAPVLADLLGMHVNTAVRWVRHAKRDWASYLAARSGSQTVTPAKG